MFSILATPPQNLASLNDVDIPDDPILDTARAPAERLVECLRQMLAQFGTEDRAHEHWRAMHDTHIAPRPDG